MKIFILFKFKIGPWGGGNQFLGGIKQYLHDSQMLAASLDEADIVLLNSFPFEAENLLFRLIFLKIKKSNTIIVHRIDGPIALYRGRGKIVDILIWKLNRLLSDGIIYQTEWSRSENQRYLKRRERYSVTIMNAPLPFFSKSSTEQRQRDKKVRLIAISWSSNWNKGFDFYQFLDDHLDFRRYTMTFVGRTPITFRNIKIIESMPSEMIAQLLARHDIYITASYNDPCSNALIEALASGLPAVARASGGHPEIVKRGGMLFSSPKELLTAIDTVAANYQIYQSSIVVPTILDAAQKYIAFCKKIYDDRQSSRYIPRRIKLLSLILFSAFFCIYKVYSRLERLILRYVKFENKKAQI